MAAILVGPPRKDVLKDYLYRKRRQVEEGGIVINAAPVATDRESQNMVSNAVAYLNAAPEVESVDFSSPAGFVVIPRADMIGLGVAIGAHVQRCFSTQKAVTEEIDAGTVTTTVEIDEAFEW
jgi:hypothetical protein